MITHSLSLPPQLFLRDIRLCFRRLPAGISDLCIRCTHLDLLDSGRWEIAVASETRAPSDGLEDYNLWLLLVLSERALSLHPNYGLAEAG